MDRRTHTRCLALLALLLTFQGFAATALAQVHQLRVVSAECTPRGCRLLTASCTATAIGRHRPGREIFLSAAHCLRGSLRSVSIRIGDSWHPAAVLAVSTRDGRDLAALGVSDPGIEPVCLELAPTPPAAGDLVVLDGFPDGGPRRRRTGRVAAHAYRDIELVVDIPTRPGESGGAILDSEGRLVGIISATGPLPTPNHTLATGIAGIRAFLHETFRAGVPRCDPAPAADHEIAISPPTVEVPSATPPDRTAAPPDPASPACRCTARDAQLAALAEQLEHLRTRLHELEHTQIPIETLTPDGEVLDHQRIPLGDPIQLRLTPVPLMTSPPMNGK
jgi:Trypsin-like peptidase domain